MRLPRPLRRLIWRGALLVARDLRNHSNVESRLAEAQHVVRIWRRSGGTLALRPMDCIGYTNAPAPEAIDTLAVLRPEIVELLKAEARPC